MNETQTKTKVHTLPLKKGLRWIARGLLALSVVIGGWIGWKFASGNNATVVEGRVYRSAQLAPKRLEKLISKHRIKTVINLRGSHPESDWYRKERQTTLANGATQVDIALSSSDWMSRDQAKTIVETLDTCEYPVIIHCWRGAERTGLVCAFTELLREHATLDDAEGQFSWRYLYFSLGDGVTTAKHISEYRSWLARNGLAHSPKTFRNWINKGYQPRHPSREDWPFDPYPLRVVTRPKTSETR